MDPSMAAIGKIDSDDFIKWLFWCQDNTDSNVDIVLWETDCFMEQETPANNRTNYYNFKKQNIDIMQRIIDECHSRGIKAYFHHRFSEVEREAFYPENDENGNIIPEGRNRVKYEHPDWVIKTWWKNGLWNLASKGMQDFKLEYLTNMMKKYNFDGICIDYLRHLPCLPVGKQWEYRHCATEFMCRLKEAMRGLGRDIMVGAKLPENLKACHEDGFDIEEWSKKKCVDFVIAGSRTINPDISGYKEIMGDREVYACWDTWHVADAYHFQSADFYRGMFSNWRLQCADGIVGFNYAPAPQNELKKLLPEDDIYRTSGDEWSEIYTHIKDSENSGLSTRYAADRRGGYPYLTGCGGNNVFAQLPAAIPNDGTPFDVRINVCAEYEGRDVGLKAVITNAKADCDKFRLIINGKEIENFRTNFYYQDGYIFWPDPQPITLRNACMKSKCANILAIEADFGSELLKVGENIVSISVIDRRNYILDSDSINIEKIELTVKEKR